MKNPPQLLQAKRRQIILEILKKEFTARCSFLSERLNVSEMTIRRDLEALDRRGLIERTHGGAVFRQERVLGKFQYQISIQENLDEKQLIARKAASLIEPEDTVYIGEGTTAALIPRYIDPKMPCCLYTNNLGALVETQNHAQEIIVLGGRYNSTTHSLAGSMTLEMIRQINVGKVFLGADGLSIRAGMTTPNLDIAVTERQMIRNTRGRVVVMANHTKFGMVADISVVPLKQIDVLVTDLMVPDEFYRHLCELGIEVMRSEIEG